MKTRVTFIIVFMVLILGFGIDLYAPSFPSIANFLKTREQLVQLTISTYFLGYTLGLLFFGPLSDAFGRKKPLIFGLIFYCLMSILCSFSPNIHALLLFRFLQGVGVASVGVMGRAILSDIFTGKKLANAMNYFVMSFRIGPIIAPLIGGYIDVYLGWRSNFYFLALYGVLVAGVSFLFLPETHEEHTPFHPRKILKSYAYVLKHSLFVRGGLCIGILYGTVIIFNIVGPFFIQDVLRYSPIAYGNIAFSLGIAAFLGILLNRLLLHYINPLRLINYGMILVFLFTILQLILALLFPVNLISFILPVYCILFASGFIVSNIMSHILDLIPRGKGIASALLGILIIATSGLLSSLASFLKTSTALPFALTYLFLILLCLTIYFVKRKNYET